MDESTCITNKQWELYATSKLPQKELAVLQAHVQTCAICADIKDGLDLMSDKSTLTKHVQTIHMKVDERIKSPTKTITLRTWFSIAAAVVLFVVVGVAVYEKKQSNTPQIAMQPQQVIPVDSGSTGSIELSKQEKSLAISTPRKSNKRPTQPAAHEVRKPIVEPQPVVSSDAVVVEEKPAQAPLVKESEEEDNQVVQTKALQAPVQESVEIQSIVATKGKRFLSRKSKAPSSTYPSNYNSTSNTQLNQLEEMDTSWVQLALSYYNQQQWDSCALAAKSYLLSNQPNTRAYALYWTAKAEWKKGNNTIAKRYLQQCMEESNVLKLEVERLLNEIP